MEPIKYNSSEEARAAFWKAVNSIREFEERSRKKIAEMETAGLLKL